MVRRFRPFLFSVTLGGAGMRDDSMAGSGPDRLTDSVMRDAAPEPEPASETAQGTWPTLSLGLGADPPVLVRPGAYTARAVGAAIRPSWGGVQKLRVEFVLVDGPYPGARLPFLCRLPRRLKNGRWGRVSPSSQFYRAWVVANGGPPRRRDRLAVDVFRHHLFRVQTRVVMKDQRQQPLADLAQYSVVATLLERIA